MQFGHALYYIYKKWWLFSLRFISALASLKILTATLVTCLVVPQRFIKYGACWRNDNVEKVNREPITL